MATRDKRRRLRRRDKRRRQQGRLGARARQSGQTKPIPGAAGTFLGRQIIVFGEKEDPTQLQRWAVPEGTILTDDPSKVFQARVRPYSLDSIVDRAAGLTRKRAQGERDFNAMLDRAGASRATFHPYSLRRLVTAAVADRELPDERSGVIGVKGLIDAQRVLMDVMAAADRRVQDGDDKAIWSMAMRSLQHQYHDQLDTGSYIRELWLSRRTVERASDLGVDLEDAYRSSLGITYSDLAVLSFAAYATIVSEDSSGVLDADRWMSPDSPIDVAPEVVERFFQLTGLDYAGLQEWAGSAAVVKKGYEPYALSPIVRWPLIQRSDGLYVAPIVRDLLDRPTRGFPIDVRQVVSSSSDSETVSRAMSEVYEDYVERLLTLALPDGATIERGKRVLPTDRLNCDLICTEGKLVTLIEVKSIHISLEADMTKDFDVLREEFRRRGIGKGLAQLNESARAIREGLTKLPANSILTGLLIVRGEQVFMNTPFLRQLLEELAEEESGRSVFIKYQVANDEGLDQLTRVCKRDGGLGQFVRNKCKLQSAEDFEETAGSLVSQDFIRGLMASEHVGEVRDLLEGYGVPSEGFELTDPVAGAQE